LPKGWKNIFVKQTTFNLLKALKKKKQTWDSFLLGIAKKSRAPITSLASDKPMSTVQTHDSPSSFEQLSSKELLEENAKLKLYNRYLVKAYYAQTEEPECNQRIYFEEDYLCCIKAPRTVKLVTLEVCQACKSRQWNLPSKRKKRIQKYPDKEWRDPMESDLPFSNEGKNYMGRTA